MRLSVLTLFSLVIVCSVHAESVKKPSVPFNQVHETPKPNDRGTEQVPIVVKVLPPTNSDESAWWLVKLTAVLAVVGVLQLVVFGLQARRLRQSVDEMKISTRAAEKAAEAAYITSVPILSPRIIDTTNLHRDIDLWANESPFLSSVGLVFNNYGKTPGIVREVRADLILSENDALSANIAFDQVTLKEHEITVPGNTVWGQSSPLPGHLVEPPVAKEFTLTTAELGEVWAEANTGRYRRFYLIGRIIYDDYFGYRSTQNFCIKLRKNGFQSPKGGSTFNSLTREKIPSN